MSAGILVGIGILLVFFMIQRANDNIAVRSPSPARRQEAGRISFVAFVLMLAAGAVVAMMALGVQP